MMLLKCKVAMRATILTSFFIFQVIDAQATTAASITTEKINDNFYVLLAGSGQGSNVGISVGSDYLVLVDAMKGKTSQKLVASIGKISDKPIKYIINTHDHFDHSDGNSFFIENGATVIAHENTKLVESDNLVTFGTNFSLPNNAENIQIFHVKSHSSNDAIVYLEKSNVILMGDVFANEWYPALFFGGISGQIEALDLALSMANDQTVIVPGHGYITNRDGLVAYKKNSMLWVNRIMELHNSGMGLEEILRDDRLNDIKNRFNTKNKDMSKLNRAFEVIVKNTIKVESGAVE